MSHGPLFFDRSNDPDYIPSIPWDTRQRVDPNRRDSQLRDRSSEWQAHRPRWAFEVNTGELHSRGYMSVDLDEINSMLAEAIKRYGNNVKQIVLHLNPSVLEDFHRWLQRCGFERSVSREGGEVPEVVFVGPPRPMKW